MKWKNTSERYGLVAVAFHWLIAVTVVGLFALGLWMHDLDYYHSWYQRAPDLHRSIGILLALAVFCRLLWRSINVQPGPVDHHKQWERRVAKVVHALLYGLLLTMFISGYLITTAKGQSLYLFDWLAIPATVTGVKNLEDLAGEIHEIAAFALIGLASLHALAALKHHWLDKDATLRRMLPKFE